MGLEMLLAQFDALIQTPVDVEKLNRLILQWGISGQLETQNSKDEPAQVFLQSIKNSKGVKDIEKSKRDEPISPALKEESLPNGWALTNLDELVDAKGIFTDGDWVISKNQNPDGEVRLIQLADIGDGHFRDKSNRFLTSEKSQELGCTYLEANDILIARMPAPLGRACLFPGNIKTCATVVDVCIVRTGEHGIDHTWLMYAINSPLIRTNIDSLATGTTRQRISRRNLSRILFPLPPLAEQKRIVARVDELLGQTAVLAQQLAAVKEQRRGMNTAVLHQLTQATESDKSAAIFPLIQRNFDRLYVDAEMIKDLKQAILQLAVQGRLVPQDPNDEPASVLLKRIVIERKRLVEEKKIRLRKVKSISGKDIPFPLPNGWVFDRFGNVTETVSGVTKGRKLQKYETVIMPYLRVANVQRGFLDLQVIKQIEIKEDEIEKYRLESGDLLLTEGGDADKVGRSAIWRDQIDPCIHQNHIFRARPILNELKAEWLMLCTNSYYGREYFLGAAKQTTNLASINMTQLVNFPLVLPPLNEQKRIMAKVDELFALCDQLAGQLLAAENGRELLLDAILTQAA